MRKHAYDFLRMLISAYLSNERLTPRQVAIEAMLIDMIAYTEGKIDDEALDRSVAAFKEYKVRILS